WEEMVTEIVCLAKNVSDVAKQRDDENRHQKSAHNDRIRQGVIHDFRAIRLRSDDDEPRSDNRTERSTSTAASGFGGRCVSRRRWSGTAFRLKEVHVVGLGIHADRLRAWKRRHGLDDGVFIR